MTLKTLILLQFLTYGMIIDLSNGVPIIGKNVRNVQAQQGYRFVASISRIAPSDTPFESRHRCTGSIISRKSILTAAHCLLNQQTSDIEIIAGSVNMTQGQKFYPQSWITFDEWKLGRKNHYSINDIALITIKGDGVRDPKMLIGYLIVDSEYLYNKEVTMAGWGKTKIGKRPWNLRRGALIVMSNKECSEEGTRLKGKTFTVPPNYFCTQSDPYVVSTCGDAGAPVLLKRQDQLVGISIGVCPILHGFDEQYLHENQMNSHLNLYYYRDFINDNRII